MHVDPASGFQEKPAEKRFFGTYSRMLPAARAIPRALQPVSRHQRFVRAWHFIRSLSLIAHTCDSAHSDTALMSHSSPSSSTSFTS